MDPGSLRLFHVNWGLFAVPETPHLLHTIHLVLIDELDPGLGLFREGVAVCVIQMKERHHHRLVQEVTTFHRWKTKPRPPSSNQDRIELHFRSKSNPGRGLTAEPFVLVRMINQMYPSKCPSVSIDWHFSTLTDPVLQLDLIGPIAKGRGG
jgi:hypothetical protein